MTNENKLGQVLQSIREEASAARAFFHTWNALNLARGDARLRATMNDCRYVDFFICSMEGSFNAFFLSLGKIFDKRKNTISLGLLSKKLRDDSLADFTQEIDEIISNHDDMIQSIRLVRNKVVAHSDLASTSEIFDKAGITPDQVEILIDGLCGLLNRVGERLGFPDTISEGARSVRAVQHILETLHDSRLPRTKTLEWSQVRQFFKDHGCVVAGHPEISWYQESWEALDRAGLASTTEFHEFELAQTTLRVRALCLLTMYLGMYQAAGTHSEFGGCFSEHSDVFVYLDSLNVKSEDIWDLARASGILQTEAMNYWEDEGTDEEQLREMAMEFAREDNAAIFGALVEHYGGMIELFESLWNSRRPSDDFEPFATAVDSMQPQEGTGEVWEYVEEGMVGWSWL